MLALVLSMSLSVVEFPPEPPVTPPPVTQVATPSLAARVLLTGVAAMAGVGASLGISYAYSLGANGKSLDYAFSNAVLAGLLATGLGFVVHQAFGAKGEVVVAMLASLAVMGVAALVANLIDQTLPNSMLLTAAIGAVPAAAATVLCLELTQPRIRVSPALNRGGAGVALTGDF